jgi:diguanylate cyclase (GGDEF)-like protein
LDALVKIVQLVGVEFHFKNFSTTVLQHVRLQSLYRCLGLVKQEDGATPDQLVERNPLQDNARFRIKNFSPIYRQNTFQPQYYLESNIDISDVFADHPFHSPDYETFFDGISGLLKDARTVDEFLSRSFLWMIETFCWLSADKKNGFYLFTEESQSATSQANDAGIEEMTCLRECSSALVDALSRNMSVAFLPSDFDGMERSVRFADSYFALPIFFEGRLIAGYYLGVEKGYRYRAADKALLEYASCILSLAAGQLLYRCRLKKMAYYDNLTTLPNRNLLLKQLKKELKFAQVNGQYGALLFVDFDRFKSLNDAFGSDVGDRILVELSERIFRQAQPSGCVARLGADEFALLLPALAEDSEICRQKAVEVAHQLLSDIFVPFEFEERILQVTASIGISLFSPATTDSSIVLRQADTAMGIAKCRGGDSFEIFCEDMRRQAETKIHLESYLRCAIQRKELRLFVQPQVDREGYMCGCEFLLRWQHAKYGMISPGHFIPVAEESGMVRQLDCWVLEAACRMYMQWQKFPGFSRLENISVNVSPQFFHQADFVDTVKRIFGGAGLPEGKLVMELTEGILISDMNSAIEKINQLHQLGIRFSIDDFGTGYSSLSYLKKLNIDELKIDQSFIRDVVTSADDSAIVTAITGLARQFGLKLVAEGVETNEQYEFLKQLDCDLYQGFLFSRPLNAELMDNRFFCHVLDDQFNHDRYTALA